MAKEEAELAAKEAPADNTIQVLELFGIPPAIGDIFGNPRLLIMKNKKVEWNINGFAVRINCIPTRKLMNACGIM